jgi:hypothetical protein
MATIRVPFEITARPSAVVPESDVPVVGRTTFDKTFATEPLIGTSVVEMVSALGASGPLAYVALERFDGSLENALGCFVLRHVGTISDGVPSLELEVVLGSGTGGLSQLSGTGTIEHTDTGAFLVLSYSLPG